MSSTTTTSERIFVLGATGNVGSQLVNELLAKNVAVTVYVRDSDKTAKMFGNPKGSFTIVQGDFNDLAPMEKALPGHTRMFLMTSLRQMASLKSRIATLAYAAGIKQIVDLSSSSFGSSWRSNSIGAAHEDAEKAILNIPNRGHAVTIRPTRFMSNMINRNPPGFEHFEDFLHPDSPQSWISPNDIAAVAAVVLTGDIEQHDDNVYELTSQVATPAELANVLTRVTGRTITYKQVSARERFNALKYFIAEEFPFHTVYALSTMVETNPHVSLGISILLGREPETLEEYFNGKKQLLIV